MWRTGTIGNNKGNPGYFVFCHRYTRMRVRCVYVWALFSMCLQHNVYTILWCIMWEKGKRRGRMEGAAELEPYEISWDQLRHLVAFEHGQFGSLCGTLLSVRHGQFGSPGHQVQCNVPGHQVHPLSLSPHNPLSERKVRRQNRIGQFRTPDLGLSGSFAFCGYFAFWGTSNTFSAFWLWWFLLSFWLSFVDWVELDFQLHILLLHYQLQSVVALSTSQHGWSQHFLEIFFSFVVMFCLFICFSDTTSCLKSNMWFGKKLCPVLATIISHVK